AFPEGDRSGGGSRAHVEDTLMIEPFETRSKPATAVLVGLVHDEQTVEQVKEYLAELEFLATTAAVSTVKRFTQRLAKPDGRTYVGSGKLKEIKDWLFLGRVPPAGVDSHVATLRGRLLH